MTTCKHCESTCGTTWDHSTAKSSCDDCGKPRKDEFTSTWITKNSISVCSQYDNGVLTLRGLHYQLVGLGMTNSIQHYKRVTSAMTTARRAGVVAYEQFSDHDREAIGETTWEETDFDDAVERAKQQVQAWMNSYNRNEWERQPKVVEVWIEKKALQGVFGPVATSLGVALCPCKGYPSLTFLYEASERFREVIAMGKQPVIVYFGDHDPSGEDIPRSIEDNFAKDFGCDVTVDIRALNKSQCIELDLPAAPAKKSDSRSANFTGLGQIELDAVKPELLQQWAGEAVADHFDESLKEEVEELAASEVHEYRAQLRDFVNQL